MANNVITLKLTGKQENTLLKTWQENKAKTPPYAKWQLKNENCVITCYESGKTVFQGKDAQVYASPFMKEETTTKKLILKTAEIFPQAGSDEVGTGDYFGPVCVCATIVDENSLPLLRKLGIRDSKQLCDEEIRKIAPEIMKVIPCSLLILDNPHYNAVHDRINLNAIKAMLHNKAYVNLASKCGLPAFRIVDQFALEKTYYSYLKNEKQVVKPIHFETKAEDKYPSVGAASVIARYAFLVKWDEMEEKYGMTFHKGGGAKADQSASLFVQKFGFDKLGEVAKLHFKNTEKLKSSRFSNNT